jgi:predicted metalloprotease with PDZ domain
VRELGAVAPMDWAAYLRTRVSETGLSLHDSLERAGLRLVYTDQPNQALADGEKSGRSTDLSYSLGMIVSRDNLLTEVLWEGPAFKAGLTTNTTLVAVNGRAYSGELLKAAITEAGTSGAPIELLVRNQDRFRTVHIDYRDGLRYPHLEQIPRRAELLGSILSPRVPAGQ